jgi:hypothetical protein
MAGWRVLTVGDLDPGVRSCEAAGAAVSDGAYLRERSVRPEIAVDF